MKKRIKRIILIVGIIVFLAILIGVLIYFNVFKITTTIQTAFSPESVSSEIAEIVNP